MVCAPVRSIIPELKLGDYLSVQAHKPYSICHLENSCCGIRDFIRDSFVKIPRDKVLLINIFSVLNIVLNFLLINIENI